MPSALGDEFDKRLLHYNRLAAILKDTLEYKLAEAGIDVLGVFQRIKTIQSILDKAERKGMADPSTQMYDICGVRVVCYYVSDLKRIDELINRELRVYEREDKSDQIEPIAFGYRSIHYIVGVPEEWLTLSERDELLPLKAEIQVRTVLSHAWADIEHKLAYKKKQDVPHKVRRKFSMLSALFEVADDVFEELRRERESYVSEVKQISDTSARTGSSDIELELNLDSLQSILDSLFPERQRSSYGTSELLWDVDSAGLGIRDIVSAWDAWKSKFPGIEQTLMQMKNWSKPLGQAATAKLSLALANADFYELISRSLDRGVLNVLNHHRSIAGRDTGT